VSDSRYDLLLTLRQEQRNHAERAGVNRCYCEFCSQACAEITVVLRDYVAEAVSR
jgi:hypothetical protein